MYATEIETDITDRFIEVPQYEKFKGQHVKIIIMSSSIERTIDENLEENLNLSKKFEISMKYRNKNPIVINKNINIDELANEGNNDIF